MISNHKKQHLASLLYITPGGEKKALNAIYAAMQDGTLRLVWRAGKFLIVTPDFLWVTESEQFLDVQSNVNWTIDL